MHLRILEGSDPDGACRLTLAGELDIATAPHLQERLRMLAAARRSVRLDFSKLDFMDSTGIAIMVAGVRASRQEGWELKIDAELSPQVAKVITVAGVEHILWPSNGR